MKPYYTLADLLDEEHPFDAGEIVPARLAVIGFPIAHSKSPAMQQAALEYPQYHWEENKGYPTISHRAAIAQHGPSPLHRMSFRLLAPQQLSLFQQ